MIRNLLYSICLHLFIALVLYTNNTVLYKPKNTLDLSTHIVDVDEEMAIKIKNSKSQKGINKLTMEEKIRLYKFIEKHGNKALKTIDKKSFSGQISNENINNLINSSINTANSNKTNIVNKTINNNAENSKNISSQTINNNKNIDVLTRNSTKIYIKESELTKVEIEKIEKKNKIEKEIRKKAGNKLPIAKKTNKFKNKNDVLKTLNNPIKTDNKSNENITENNIISQSDEDSSNFTDLDSLLDNLANENIKDISSKFSEEEIMKIDLDNIFNQDDYEKISNNNKKSIYDLSIREKVNIQKQIKMCYKNAILKTKKTSNLLMSVNISVSRDGVINMNTINFNVVNEHNSEQVDRNDYNKTIENIKLALIYCNPLRNLPYQKYNIWKNMNLLFNNN